MPGRRRGGDERGGDRAGPTRPELAARGGRLAEASHRAVPRARSRQGPRVHGSDSPASAEREIALFFPGGGLYEVQRDIDRWVFE